MLQAFQRQLDALAADYDNEFERQVARRWGKELPRGLVEDLKQFICLLPAIEKRVYALYVWLPEDSKVRHVGGYFLTYMYQPDDFLPANEANGLMGYLDDAYIARLFYELMIEEIDRTKQFRLRKQDRELLVRVIRLSRKAEAVIPDEAINIKQMLGDLFEGDDATFQQLFAGKIPA